MMKSINKISQLFLLLLILGAVRTSATPVRAADSPPVLAFYYAWFDQNTWTSDQSVDLPAEPYISADRAVIERHVRQAQNAGINAFVQSWYGPQEANNQTETNFRMLLEVSAATGFKAAVDVETMGPFFGDAGAVTNALATLLTTHAQHPAYLRYQGKPVIFFWRQQRFSVDEWQAIRNQVDPDRTTFWIAEGVDIDYQAVFDGHHLYSIAWADSPAGQLAKWGDRVRAFEANNQVDRLWVATAMPGYDDTRLPRDDAFAVPRRAGDYFRETWQGAVASQPDMVIITSFNEWPEGTHIEPSAAYGNLYLDITRELVTGLRGSPPPAAIAAAQTDEETPTPEPPPDGPYIQTGALTNVRRGPDTSFEKVGSLAANSTAIVTGQNESGTWWQIEFEAADGSTWVAAEVVEFTGNADEVPVVEAPTPEPTVAPAPDSEQPATASVEAPDGGVNIRRGPGLNFEQIGLLEGGESLPVVGQNQDGTWWQVEFEAGENGLAWIAAAVVNFSGEPATVPLVQPAAIPTAVVTPTPTVPVVQGTVTATDPVNVRSEPSLEGVIVGGLYPGDSADVVAVSEDSEWWQIDFADGPEGLAWVAAEFVEFEGEPLAVPIFGQGTVTPTPRPTNTPTPTALPPSPTPLEFPPTFAPTATSVYQPTSEALLNERGTPDPSLTELEGGQTGVFSWGALPWGIGSIIVIAVLLWFQLKRRR